MPTEKHEDQTKCTDSTKLRKNEYKELEKEGLEGFEILAE